MLLAPSASSCSARASLTPCSQAAAAVYREFRLRITATRAPANCVQLACLDLFTTAPAPPAEGPPVLGVREPQAGTATSQPQAGSTGPAALLSTTVEEQEPEDSSARSAAAVPGPRFDLSATDPPAAQPEAAGAVPAAGNAKADAAAAQLQGLLLQSSQQAAASGTHRKQLPGARHTAPQPRPQTPGKQSSVAPVHQQVQATPPASRSAADLRPELDSSSSEAAQVRSPVPASDSSKQTRMAELIRSLFLKHVSQGMQPDEAASRALREAQTQLG